jgi:hypothetical protein
MPMPHDVAEHDGGQRVDEGGGVSALKLLVARVCSAGLPALIQLKRIFV